MPRIDIGAVLADKAPRLARWIPGFVIGWLRRTIHESEINYILEHYWNLPPQEFIRACFREWQVTYTVEGLEKLDPKGRYLFAANHPFGGMDGMMLADKLRSCNLREPSHPGKGTASPPVGRLPLHPRLLKLMFQKTACTADPEEAAFLQNPSGG